MKIINFLHDFSINFCLDPTVRIHRQNIYMKYVPNGGQAVANLVEAMRYNRGFDWNF